MKLIELTQIEVIFLLEQFKQVKECPYDLQDGELDEAIELLQKALEQEYNIE